MINIYDVIGKLCGVLQIVNLFIWERKQAAISYLGKMIVMVEELHSESSNTSLKSWCTIQKYWPLLEQNKLFDGQLELVKVSNYEFRCDELLNDESPVDHFTKTRRELQEYLESLQVCISNILLSNVE